MIRLTTLTITISILLLISSTFLLAPGASGEAEEFFPLDRVTPGMKGYGRTVFQGTKVEEFQCEILGVLKNIAPGQNLILAKLSGGPLGQTGVYAGMSGSPVYIDGKLLGAVAYSFPFSKEPIAGITPIHEMVNIFEGPPAERSLPRITVSDLQLKNAPLMVERVNNGFKIPDLDLRLFHNPSGLRLSGQTLAAIVTPINFSGFSPRALDQYASQFQALGLTPVAGSAGARPSEAEFATKLEGGSNISVQLARGDLDISASGTCTYVKGDKLYAFGHPFLGMGYTELPLNRGQVLTILPNMVTSSAVAASIRPIGTIKQDRATGVMGVLGTNPKMIPVDLTLHTSRNREKNFKYEVISDRFLTPLLVNLTVFNIIVSSERALGDATYHVKGRIKIKNHPEVSIEDIFSAKLNSQLIASRAVATPVYFLLAGGFENFEMESIHVDLISSEVQRDVIVDRVWYDKTKVKDGEEVNLSVSLKKENGEEFTQTYPIKIPEGIVPGPISILISDGDSLAMTDAREAPGNFIPENLNQLIKAINNLKRSNRLYVRIYRRSKGAIIRGEGLPDLPPSIISLLDSKKSNGGIQPINVSTFIEYEMPPTEFVISGQKVIEVEVVPG